MLFSWAFVAARVRSSEDGSLPDCRSFPTRQATCMTVAILVQQYKPTLIGIATLSIYTCYMFSPSNFAVILILCVLYKSRLPRHNDSWNICCPVQKLQKALRII